MTNNKEKPTKQKLLEVVSGNRKLQDVKLIQQKSFSFSYTSNEKVDGGYAAYVYTKAVFHRGYLPFFV